MTKTNLEHIKDMAGFLLAVMMKPELAFQIYLEGMKSIERQWKQGDDPDDDPVMAEYRHVKQRGEEEMRIARGE
jgi:hypothetical protein